MTSGRPSELSVHRLPDGLAVAAVCVFVFLVRFRCSTIATNFSDGQNPLVVNEQATCEYWRRRVTACVVQVSCVECDIQISSSGRRPPCDHGLSFSPSHTSHNVLNRWRNELTVPMCRPISTQAIRRPTGQLSNNQAIERQLQRFSSAT